MGKLWRENFLYLGIEGDFRKEEVEGIVDGQGDHRSLTGGDSDSCF